MNNQEKLYLFTLSLTNFITVLANTILYPVFPEMSRDLNLTLKDLALLVGIVSFPAGIINLLAGYLGERFGLKRINVISLLLYGSGGIVIIGAITFLASPYSVILVGRFIQGLGSAAPMFLNVALASQIFQDEKRATALGWLEGANGLGKISSPLIGAIFALFSWKALFFIYPVLAFPVAYLTQRIVKDPEGTTFKGHKQLYLKMVLGKSRLLSLAAAFSAAFLLFGTLFWLSDFAGKELHYGPLARGAMIAIAPAFLAISSLFANYFARKIGIKWTIASGIGVMSMALLILPFILDTILLWLVLALLGTGAGIVFPGIDACASRLREETTRGSLAGIYGSVRCFGAALAPIGVSLLLGLFEQSLFIIISGAGFLVATTLLIGFYEKELSN